MNQEDDFQHKIDLTRQELLDMGLRANPLLNFCTTAKTLTVIEESAQHIFDLLITQKKALRFLPQPEQTFEPTQTSDITTDDIYADNPSAELPCSTANSDIVLPPQLVEYSTELSQQGYLNLTDRHLQTTLDKVALYKTLLKIENEARTRLQEQGVEVLYLALGYLTWFEDDSSSTARQAPLLLIPVELYRRSAREGLSIAWTEADLSYNLALATKLKGEFHLELPNFNEELDPVTYFEQVREAIATKPRWQVVNDEIHLGLFSFGKFQMFNDLDPENWPKNKPLARHPILIALFGNGFSRDREMLDDISTDPQLNTPEQLQLIKDADSSQTEAVLAAIRGANLVIQGPPGTGKSQTITNIISEAVAKGRKILFVAQKMAALNVVKQRLDESQLGSAVLELHSHKSTKKAFLETLKHTLEQTPPANPDYEQQHQRLEKVRAQLDGYAEAIRQPILNSGESYTQALGKHLKWQLDFNAPSIDFEIIKQWDREDLADARRIIHALVDHINDKGIPSQNPFFASTRAALSPQEQQQISALAVNSQAKLESLIDESRQMATDLRIDAPRMLSEMEVLRRTAMRAISMPALQDMPVNDNAWQQRKKMIRELIGAGTAMSELKVQYQNHFVAQAFDADILSIKKGLINKTDKWWRFLSDDYRNAKSAYLALRQGEVTDTPNEWLTHLHDLLTYQTHHRHYRHAEAMGLQLFQSQWQGERSDWQALTTKSEWLIKLHDDIASGEIAGGIVELLAEHPLTDCSVILSWQQRLDRLSTLISELYADIKELLEKIKLAIDKPCSDIPLARITELLTCWQTTDKLYDIARYNHLCNELKALKLHTLVELSKTCTQPANTFEAILLNSYYGGLVAQAYDSHAAIREFDRNQHEALQQEFTQLDQSLFDIAQQHIVNTLYQALPNKHDDGGMQILQKEFNKKRRHLAIRRLIRDAGSVIQQIKPVFMMSPMSVATYLPQGLIEFDLVIFDEASQIPAADAFGSIARAKQVIVVGDSKQMPPTNLFSREVELDDDTAEQSETADIESILSLMEAKGTPEVMLRWHYRSRHHSLIAVSNAKFYHNKLMIFPSPNVETDATGLRLHINPHSTYDCGGSSTNQQEALQIAEAVMDHARHKPHLSLGVAAFSLKQSEAIELEVERLRRENLELEPFFTQRGSDEFFIKNLDNIQGDERDVIFISIGYGRTPAGRISQNFGPINNINGERRINVLITRARMAMEVFCNFGGDELVTTATSKAGLLALKTFLQYAKSGELQQSYETDCEADSPFEEEVLKAIENLGYRAEAQVGCNGFYIDLAVRDPNKAGRYILAVECDGASYHSSAIARDRDRIRQHVLEGLGWRFHRIWSTDWFRNQPSEIARLKQSIEVAVAHYQELDKQNDSDNEKSVERKPSAVLEFLPQGETVA